MSDTTTPAARHALYAALEGAIGKPHADTLMTYLPAHGADEAATKADVATLEDRFDHLEDRFGHLEVRFDHLEGRFDRLEDRFDRLEDRFDRFEDRFDHWQRTTLVVVVSAMTGLTAIFSAIVLIAA